MEREGIISVIRVTKNSMISMAYVTEIQFNQKQYCPDSFSVCKYFMNPSPLLLLYSPYIWLSLYNISDKTLFEQQEQYYMSLKQSKQPLKWLALLEVMKTLMCPESEDFWGKRILRVSYGESKDSSSTCRLILIKVVCNWEIFESEIESYL